ncbi:MAG: hypothetical protein ACR2JB_23530 [Bryobacteraceae bacterium]
MATAIHTPLADAAQLLAQQTLDKLRAKHPDADALLPTMHILG